MGIPGVQDRDTVFIGGRWVPADAGGTLEVVDPTTEAVLARVPDCTAADVDRAVAAARAALDGWAATPIADRAALLRRLSAAMRDHGDELADIMSAEMGAPAKLSRLVQVGSAVAVLDAYAEIAADYPLEEREGKTVLVREPVGVVAAITPWNYPLYQVTAKVGAALAAGCTVVLKPSESAPLAVYRFAELVEEVGFPAGVFNLVCGTGPVVGQAMAAHPDVDMVSFTGSTRAGTEVAATAAATVKRVALELGGKSASVLLPDLDAEGLAKAVKGTMSQAYMNSGQRCSAHARILVPAGRAGEAAEAAAKVAASQRVGAPGEDGVRIGPLVTGAQRDRVRGFIERAIADGAVVVAGGPEAPRETGYFVQPTVLAGVTEDMEIAREEIFGPVVTIQSYVDVDDAVRIANGTDYGLAGGVWGADADAALGVARRIRAGQVDVNGGNFNPAAPFGGYRKSGNGRELGRAGLEEYFEIKALQL
ncbi:MAG: aldehyde dehydrogenase family protein [Cryptosporangiaceae bacterium]|nr:aldehyde dehydrogenase family protein [Cryptosporangiaceae bacterium]